MNYVYLSDPLTLRCRGNILMLLRAMMMVLAMCCNINLCRLVVRVFVVLSFQPQV